MLGTETTLYSPVKRFLESLGFEVRGEVCGCDVVALDKGVPTSVVIAELNSPSRSTCCCRPLTGCQRVMMSG